MIVVDGVFSMEGDVANLPKIVELKKRFGTRLMVDDAHGIGVMGANGRGTAEHFDVDGEADLVMGTFSKSLAGVGGFIVGESKVIDWIKHKARPLMFSASPPPASVASVIKALEVMIREPERRHQLWEITDYMKREFINLGFDTGNSASPVIPLLVGEDVKDFAAGGSDPVAAVAKRLERRFDLHALYRNQVSRRDPQPIPRAHVGDRDQLHVPEQRRIAGEVDRLVVSKCQQKTAGIPTVGPVGQLTNGCCRPPFPVGQQCRGDGAPSVDALR